MKLAMMLDNQPDCRQQLLGLVEGMVKPCRPSPLLPPQQAAAVPLWAASLPHCKLWLHAATMINNNPAMGPTRLHKYVCQTCLLLVNSN